MQPEAEGALIVALSNKWSTSFVNFTQFCLKSQYVACLKHAVFFSTKAPSVTVSGYKPVMHNFFTITHYFGIINMCCIRITGILYKVGTVNYATKNEMAKLLAACMWLITWLWYKVRGEAEKRLKAISCK